MSRKMTPKGGMASNGSGPAIMMMPPHIRATFMPNPPIKPLPPPNSSRSNNNTPYRPSTLSGIAHLMPQFEKSKPPRRRVGLTPATAQALRQRKKARKNLDRLEPLIAAYRSMQKESGGEFLGMNCYNTLFVGRLAYEVTERKLLREMEIYGPVKDLKLVVVKSNKKSRGYAFVEYEHEEDMKRAYRGADGMKIDGREVVVDVERGHTVPQWLPRRLGGGLGGTRIGGRKENYTAPGRFDPKKPPIRDVVPNMHGHGPQMRGGMPMNMNMGMGMGMGPNEHQRDAHRGDRGPPMPYYNDQHRGPPNHHHHMHAHPPHHQGPNMDMYRGPPGPDMYRGGGGGGGPNQRPPNMGMPMNMGMGYGNNMHPPMDGRYGPGPPNDTRFRGPPGRWDHNDRDWNRGPKRGREDDNAGPRDGGGRRRYRD